MTRDEFLQKFSLHRLERHFCDHHANMRQAAVLVPIVARPEGLQVILTRRASHLRHHPGQISFPGGKLEPNDPSLQQAALREANEEIGLAPSKVSPLGHINPISTITRFAIAPIIGLVEADYALTLDHNEVAEAFEVPLSFLLNPQNHRSHTYRGHTVYFMPYRDKFIWGATARIIKSLAFHLSKSPDHLIHEVR